MKFDQLWCDKNSVRENLKEKKSIRLYGMHSSFYLNDLLSRNPIDWTDCLFSRMSWFGMGTYFSLFDESGLDTQLNAGYGSYNYILAEFELKNPMLIDGTKLFFSQWDISFEVSQLQAHLLGIASTKRTDINDELMKTTYDGVIYFSNKKVGGEEQGSQAVIFPHMLDSCLINQTRMSKTELRDRYYDWCLNENI